MAKEKILTFVQTRSKLSEIVDRVAESGEIYVVSKRQKPVAVIIGIEKYRELSGTSKYLKTVGGKKIINLEGIATAIGLDSRSHFFDKSPQRGARRRVGQAAQCKVSRQFGQVQTLTHVRDFVADFRRVTDKHAVLLDQIVEGELAHFGAMFVMGPVRLRLGDALSQIARFGRRGMVRCQRRLRGRTSLPVIFTDIDVIHRDNARRVGIMARGAPRAQVNLDHRAQLVDLVEKRNEHQMKAAASGELE